MVTGTSVSRNFRSQDESSRVGTFVLRNESSIELLYPGMY